MAHEVHEEEPESENWPAEHEMHVWTDGAATRAEYVPALQLIQEEEPAELHVPAIQLLQEVALDVANWPAKHEIPRTG